MTWNDFRNFCQIIQNDKLSLFYAGDFSDEITVRLIDLSELSFTSSKGRATMKKKVSFLMAECFQNVIRHTDIDPGTGDTASYSGFFMTRNIGGNYYIASGNLIHNEDITGLQSKIDDLNNLNKQELKELYMNVLDTGSISAKGGAGLGLIDMARKSGKKLDAQFLRVNDKLTNFYLQIFIDKEGQEEFTPGKHLDDSKAVLLNDLMRKNNVILAYQGDFNQDSILPILTMIDQNMATNPAGRGFNKNLYHEMVEILQNIMHHGYTESGKTEGIFAIGIRDNLYIVDAANYIRNDLVPAFRNSLEQYLDLDREGLKTYYKKILKEGRGSPGDGAGLGLIDIIRVSKTKPVVHFEPVDGRKTMFCLSITV